MRTEDLSQAYDKLLSVAGAITDDDPITEAARTQIDWVITHIALSDRMLADTARSILNGREAYVDNASAMSSTTIGTLVSTSSHRDRVDMARHNAHVLIGILDEMPQAAADVDVRTRLVNRDGETVFDGFLAWGDIIHTRTTQHIPGHTATLARLTGNSNHA
ncbi:hypothetical protein JOL79_23705 [Microbispora sp. RL4-1S]|uniref:DinB family protein n=1 Tax=Microbispora oryzae TaxID=2806554 RepID=A0A940WJS1_9ACTN|nr:hypothetical protein [Microbispora oryzae]MBP2706816.1 hypothetical protein [Microbispora oryzae]